ncbi:unnamed protein product [Malus baccata var. baccata]
MEQNHNLTVISEGDVSFSALPPSRSSSVQSTFCEAGSRSWSRKKLLSVMLYSEELFNMSNLIFLYILRFLVAMAASIPHIAHSVLLASQTSTPRLTPPGSPPIFSASTSPTRSSKPVSPKRHSITRVDGKEFFRQVRSRLSYEQFGAFLENVKELNWNKQTKESQRQEMLLKLYFSNGSRETAKDNEEAQATTKPSTLGGSRRARAGFSDSFSSQDLRSLNLDEDVSVDEPSSRGVSEDEYCPRSVGSETSSPKASTSDSDGRGSITTSDSNPRTNHHRRGFFGMLKKGPQNPFPTFPPKGAKKSKLTRRKTKRIREEFIPQPNSPAPRSFDADFCRFKSSWKNYSFLELQAATNNFSHENLIGEGGYADVYKGTLEDGQIVAIKCLTRGTQEEMTADFLSELGVIVHVDHPNIAKLIGYGVEGGMHLVLHLSPHGSLSSILYGPRENLDWGIRYKVALGTAKGLLYLHEGCQRRIIHKDIKASNILLAEDFEPLISDFGLAKWLPDSWTHHIVSKFEGTFGYLPPEFFMHGIVDEKTDVYAYGVLILELITGRQALDRSHKSLVMWIVEILEGDEGSLEYATKRQKSKLQRTYSEELLDADDYNSTKAFVYEGLLTDAECDHLISIAKSELKRSAVADNLSGQSKLSEVRTSSGMFIPKAKDPIVAGIEDKLATWTFLPKENGEDIQVLRYESGQKYAPHYDYFVDKVNIARGGHRVATVLLYLTDVAKGGETVFPEAEVSCIIHLLDSVIFIELTRAPLNRLVLPEFLCDSCLTT